MTGSPGGPGAITSVDSRPGRSGGGRVSGLADTFFFQCGPHDDDLVAMLPAGMGVIESGKAGLAAARQILNSGFCGPVLADRRRYSGQRRVAATEPLSEAWIDKQRGAQLTAALTDSGYLAAGDLHGILNILSSAAGLGPDVIAVLPLHPWWLRDGLPRLIGEIQAHAVPVALVVEHRRDPFGVARNLRGLVQLLSAVSVPVLQLCADVSALGALAFGATAAAVGVRSSLRHLYPATAGGFSRGVEAVLFQPGLAFVHVDKLARGVAAMPSDPLWECQCTTCLGRRMDWLLFASQHEQRAHTMELLTDQHEHLLRSPPGPDRRQSWRAACASAEYQFTSVAVSCVGWEVPDALRHWQRV